MGASFLTEQLSHLFGTLSPESPGQDGCGPAVGPAEGRVEGADTPHTHCVLGGGGKSVTCGHPHQWSVTVAGHRPVGLALL